jgi:hypothetical protein
MKKALLLTGILLALVAAPRAARAQYVSGAELERACLSRQREQTAACINYIAGVIDYHTLLQSFGTAPTIDFCLPATLPVQDAALVVLQYLRTHRQHMAFIASTAVPLALNEAFPCKPRPAKKTKKRRS